MINTAVVYCQDHFQHFPSWYKLPELSFQNKDVILHILVPPLETKNKGKDELLITFRC